MKIFTNKNLIQKIIIAFVCVILLEFSLAPSTVRAETSFGGELMGAMRDFITAVADVAISVIQLGLTGEWSFAVDEKGSGKPDIENGYFDKDNFRYPVIQISPELIFSNQVRLLDVNFIRGGSRDSYIIDSEGSQTAIDSLRRVIASWYVTLRTIAIVGLLSVLIYIGIRIIISSTSQDRAKYKQRIMDWIIAFCLLFFMHYIMAGVLGAVDRINNALSVACGLGDGSTSIEGIPLNTDYGGVQYTGDLEHAASQGTYIGGSQDIGGAPILSKDEVSDRNGAINKIKEQFNDTLLEESGEWQEEKNVDSFGLSNANVKTIMSYTITYQAKTVIIYEITEIHNYGTSASGIPVEKASQEYRYISIDNAKQEKAEEMGTYSNRNGLLISDDSSKVIYFINYARMYLNCEDDDNYMAMAFGYLFIYIVLIVFTAMFAIRYVKRVIYLAFLTLMAPMVALTYPLDKIKDRKSPSI